MPAAVLAHDITGWRSEDRDPTLLDALEEYLARSKCAPRTLWDTGWGCVIRTGRRADWLPDADVAAGKLPHEVQAFCNKHELLDHLLEAVNLARKHFEIELSDVEVGIDPATGEQWLALRALARGSVEEILAREEAYVDEFDATVPPYASSMIRLIYDVE